MKNYTIFLAGALLLSLCSCNSSLKLFTHEMDARLTEEQIKKAQFYNSKTIVLKREIQKGEAGVSNGEIHLIDGKYYQIIEVEKLTPGVCLWSSKYDGKDYGSVGISFDNTNRTMTFWTGNVTWDNDYYIETNKGLSAYGKYRQTTFDGKVFDIIKGSDLENGRDKYKHMSKLMVKNDRKQNSSSTKEILKGRTIDK